MSSDHPQGKHKLSRTIDNVVKEDEGFFTASSSSDSEPEKEVSSEATLLNIAFPINQQNLTYLTQEQTDSPMSVYMEAMNEPSQETDQKKEESPREVKEKLGDQKEQEVSLPARDLKVKLGEQKDQEVSSPARRRKFGQKEGLSLISELDSGLSSLNHELDGMVDEKAGVGGDRMQSRTLQRSFSNLEKLRKEMEEELAKSGLDGVEGTDQNANNLKLNVNHLNTQKGNSKEEQDKPHEFGNGFIALEKKIEESGSDQFSIVQNEMTAQILALTKEVSQLQEETDLQRKLDEQINSQEREINWLRGEREALQAKLSKIEITLTEKKDEIAVLRKRHQLTESESSARVSDLSAQIRYLQEELSSEKQRSQERITQLEYQNSELISKLSDQQETQKQQEDTIVKLREESKLVKGRFLQAADRKIDEVAEEFKKNFEDKLRILSQRIRVAEQLHVETKDNWKKTKDQCEQEHPDLEKKLEDITKTSQAELWKMSDSVDEMMKGMELVITNFETKETGFMERISRVSNEIQVSKNWVKLVMEELKPLKNEGPSSPFAPTDEREKEKMMEEKVVRLEAKVKKERADKMRLIRGMYELQNKVSELEKVIVEKDEGLVRLSEEKIEAIKQLCLWIDYHQCRFDHLKEVVLVKSKSKGRKH